MKLPTKPIPPGYENIRSEGVVHGDVFARLDCYTMGEPFNKEYRLTIGSSLDDLVRTDGLDVTQIDSVRRILSVISTVAELMNSRTLREEWALERRFDALGIRYIRKDQLPSEGQSQGSGS